MKLLIDMNLSPAWVDILQQAGFDAIHWSEIGSPNAPDTILFVWAREHGFIVFTHDMIPFPFMEQGADLGQHGLRLTALAVDGRDGQPLLPRMAGLFGNARQ